MSSGMIFLMLMVHDFKVVRLKGGLMLSFCWRTLNGCVRSLVRLSLRLLSTLGFDAASAFGPRVGLDLLLAGSRGFFLVIVLHGEVVLQGGCSPALASGGHVVPAC